jgi:hypothetical protein
MTREVGILREIENRPSSKDGLIQNLQEVDPGQ